MKNLIVYYSWIGNTEVVAREIHKLVGGDIRKISEIKVRKPGMGFGTAAFSAILGIKSRLKDTDFSMDGYENIFLGAQVWAGHSTPAINAFLTKADFKNKNVYLFMTKADDKVPQKVIDSIKQRIEKRGGRVMDCFSATTRIDTIISPDDIKGPLSDWAARIAK